MRELLTELVAGKDARRARLEATEYLQERVLVLLQEEGAMIPLAFQGGTALRVLYGLDRYSEELDFALERRTDLYRPQSYVRGLRSGLAAQGYSAELALQTTRPVHVLWVRFPGLPRELGFSPHEAEKLAIKLEVDTNPPTGAVLATTVVRRGTLLNLQHHDRATLFAGKLHAVLARPHAKGRDFYDLFWYLAAPDWPEPNIAFLNAALGQSGHDELTYLAPASREGDAMPVARETPWPVAVVRRVESLDWQSVRRDALPFIEERSSREAFTKDALLALLRQRVEPPRPGG